MKSLVLGKGVINSRVKLSWYIKDILADIGYGSENHLNPQEDAQKYYTVRSFQSSFSLSESGLTLN